MRKSTRGGEAPIQELPLTITLTFGNAVGFLVEEIPAAMNTCALLSESINGGADARERAERVWAGVSEYQNETS